MALDFVAAQAVAKARLLERAVHDLGPWQIEVGGQRNQCVKMLGRTRIVFLAHFDAQSDDADVAWLYCGDELLTSMDTAVLAGSRFDIEWEIAMEGLTEPVGA